MILSPFEKADLFPDGIVRPGEGKEHEKIAVIRAFLAEYSVADGLPRGHDSAV
jgi:hypothetical protein